MRRRLPPAALLLAAAAWPAAAAGLTPLAYALLLAPAAFALARTLRRLDPDFLVCAAISLPLWFVAIVLACVLLSSGLTGRMGSCMPEVSETRGGPPQAFSF